MLPITYLRLSQHSSRSSRMLLKRPCGRVFISHTSSLNCLCRTIRLRRSVMRMCPIVFDDCGHELSLLMVLHHVSVLSSRCLDLRKYQGRHRLSFFGFRLTRTYPQNHVNVEALSEVGLTPRAHAETKSLPTRNPDHRTAASASTLQNPPFPNTIRRG